MKVRIPSDFSAKSVECAALADWLKPSVMISIVKQANMAGAQLVLDEIKEDFVVLFPNLIQKKGKDNTILGLMLDKNSGWLLVGFLYNPTVPKNSKINKLYLRLGHGFNKGWFTKMARALRDSPDPSTSAAKLGAFLQGTKPILSKVKHLQPA